MKCTWCSNPEGMDRLAGKEISADDILAECKSCVPMFFSGGGVTFTGGEATLQTDELLYVLQKLKEANIHTAIETNGTSEKLLEISEYVDYLIMDFKHYDSEILKKFTGVGNEKIKDNFQKLCRINKPLHIRIPIINGINSQEPRLFAEYFKKYATEFTDFEFLPYHEYGKEKWQSEYKVQNGFITKETLQEFNHVFSEYGLKIIKS